MAETSNLDPSSSFSNNKGAAIYRKVWPLKEGTQPSGVVLLCHGVAVHSLRYATIAAALNEKGFIVYCHDHVGHGRSDGARVEVDDFDQYVDDTLEHINIIRKEVAQVSLFLIGFSMGGLIAGRTALRLSPERFGGVVFVAAALASSISSFQIFFAKIVARVMPQFHITKVKADNLTRDKALVEDYKQDPMVYHDGIKARLAVQVLSAMTDFQDKMAAVTYPCLILQGDRDEIVLPSGSTMLYERAASQDKVLKVYEGFYHQPHNEPGEDGKRVIKDITDWLLART